MAAARTHRGALIRVPPADDPYATCDIKGQRTGVCEGVYFSLSLVYNKFDVSSTSTALQPSDRVNTEIPEGYLLDIKRGILPIDLPRHLALS